MLDNRSPLGVALRNPISSVDEDDERDITAYANGRIGTKPQLTVTFRKVDGSSHSFAYSHLYRIETATENGGFTAEFSHHTVTVQGRNLTHLHRLLCHHKVHTIQETSATQAMGIDENQPVVTGMYVTKNEAA